MHVCVGLRPSLHSVPATQENLWGDLKTPDDVQAASQVNGTLGISGCRSWASGVPQEVVPAAGTDGCCPGGFDVGETPPLFCLSSLLFLHFSPCLDQFPLGSPIRRRRNILPPHWMCLSSGATPRADLPHPWAELIHNTAGKASARSTIRHITPSAAGQWQAQHFSAALLGKQREISP